MRHAPSPPLADRVREPRFWTDAYWITQAEWVGDEPAHGELGRVDFTLGGHTLSLSLGDLYHSDWHPHLLR